MVGDDIEITVAEIMGKKVRLGITAPPGVLIHRKELWLTIQGNEAVERNDE